MKNYNIYFIGYKKTDLSNSSIELLFDIYDKNVLLYRFIYPLDKSPIILSGFKFVEKYKINPKIFIDISSVSDVIEYTIIDSIHYSINSKNIIYSYIARDSNKQIVYLNISSKLYFYMSFIIYFFKNDFGIDSNYLKYDSFIDAMKINRTFGDKIISKEEYTAKHMIERYNFKLNDVIHYIDINTIIFEDTIGQNSPYFRFMQLLDTDIPKDDDNIYTYKPLNDNINNLYAINILYGKEYIPSDNYNFFRLISGDGIIFMRKVSNGGVQFVVPKIVKSKS